MVFDGSFFTYGDFDSEDYGLIFAHTGTSIFDSLYGELSISTVFHKRGIRNLYIGDDYSSSPLKFEIDIVNVDGESINTRDLREIENSLFGNKKYQKLYVNNICDEDGQASEIVCGEEKRLYFNCRLMNPKKIESSSGVVGFTVSVECDSMFMWQDPVKEVLYPGNNTIYVDTDYDAYIYPQVTITPISGSGAIESVSIFNITDSISRETAFYMGSQSSESSVQYSEIIINGGINMVTPYTAYNYMSQRNFPRLLRGENNIHIGEGIVVTMEWRNRRYVV